MNNIGNPDLIQYLFDLSARCDEEIRHYAKCGEQYAQAEHDYQVSKSQTALRLEANGKTSTMIGHILKGIKGVAENMLKRDIAKSRYEVSREKINLLKLQIRIVDGQIQREWGRNE